MVNDFQQTVDLKKRMEQSRQPRPAPEPKPEPKPKPVLKKVRKKAEDIDRVYSGDEETREEERDLRKINQPVRTESAPNFYKYASFVMAAVILAVTGYFLFFSNQDTEGEVAGETTANYRWYAVKLINDEIYYGQIADISADPIVIDKVYYNYDQGNEGDETSPSGNLRLVKRGKETHGPEGTMNIVRSQVVYMEPLKEDSKVLRAILDYER